MSHSVSHSTGRAPARVGVVGATGYAGVELLRLLSRHPGVKLVAAMTSGRDPRVGPVGDFIPALRGVAELEIAPGTPEKMLEIGVDAVLLATPHEASMNWVRALLTAQPDVKIVDLSGAFRLQDVKLFEHWYRLTHTATEWVGEAVYGWPEKYAAQVKTARLVANPGCYATAANTVLWPLMRASVIDGHVICDAKSGASGAGKGLREDLHFVELAENFKAYGVQSHRHTPEIADQSGIQLASLTFTPHLLPINRGILTTTYLQLTPGARANDVARLYQEAYAGSPFVRISDQRLPEVNDIAHTNFCDIGFRVDEQGRAIIVSCLDNLLKGAAGQAVQNLNLMLGWEETTALL